jgi:hypothetical protein
MTVNQERHECGRLFDAATPFVRAEREAERALTTAKVSLKAARKDAARARAAWVDFLLTHDHQAVCLGRSEEASG